MKSFTNGVCSGCGNSEAYCSCVADAKARYAEKLKDLFDAQRGMPEPIGIITDILPEPTILEYEYPAADFVSTEVRVGVTMESMYGEKVRDMGSTERVMQSISDLVAAGHIVVGLEEVKAINASLDLPDVIQNTKFKNRHRAFKVWADAIQVALECGFNEDWVVQTVYADENDVPNEDLMMARNLFDWSVFDSTVRKINGR